MAAGATSTISLRGSNRPKKASAPTCHPNSSHPSWLTSNFAHADAIARLRQSLDLPLPGKITPANIAGASLPRVRVPRLEIADVSDDDLVQLYRRAMIASGGGAMAVLATEVVRRPSLEDKIPLLVLNL